jgi:hypothetical protein
MLSNPCFVDKKSDTDSIFTQTKYLQARYSSEVSQVPDTIERAWKDVKEEKVGKVEMKPDEYQAWRKKVDAVYNQFLAISDTTEDPKELQKKIELAQKYVDLVCRKAILEQGQICAKLISERIQEMMNVREGGSIESLSIALQTLQKSNKKFTSFDELIDSVSRICAFGKLPDKPGKPMSTEEGHAHIRKLLCDLQLMDVNIVKTITEKNIDQLIVGSGTLVKTMNLELEKQMNRAIFFRRKMYAFRFCWPGNELLPVEHVLTLAFRVFTNWPSICSREFRKR